MLHRALFLAAAAFVSLTGACRGGEGNLLDNPSFEAGSSPWYSLESDAWVPGFAVVNSPASEGSSSARLTMDSSATLDETAIWGIVQEVTPAKFPEELSGSYFVEGWRRGGPQQYLQVVVIVFEAENGPAGLPNHQIRYILDGSTTPPFEIQNAKFVFLGGPEPQQGAWVSFKRDVAEDFRKLWGSIPEDFEKVRLLYEVRYDSKPPEQIAAATVYYDSLYFGAR